MIKALLLNSVLFSGEIFQYIMGMTKNDYKLDLICLKNLVIAPFLEEFIYRVCMVNLMLESNSLDEVAAVLILPLFFSLSHLHHELFVEEKRAKRLVVLRCVFKLAYTQIFGIYSGLVYIRTGSIWPAFALHSQCNYFGFPGFGQIFNKNHRRTLRAATAALYLFGLVFYYFSFDLVFPGSPTWWN